MRAVLDGAEEEVYIRQAYPATSPADPVGVDVEGNGKKTTCHYYTPGEEESCNRAPPPL